MHLMGGAHVVACRTQAATRSNINSTVGYNRINPHAIYQTIRLDLQMTQNNDPIAAARTWLKEWVIGLNLCPFARDPHDKNRIRFMMDDSSDPYESLSRIILEIGHLRSGESQTTLIVYPGDGPFREFDDFMDYCAAANDLLRSQNLDRDIQLAYFHPHYVFEDSPENDPANQVNRSPSPILHLLRVKDVEEAIQRHPDTAGISFANMKKLRAMEKEKKTKA